MVMPLPVGVAETAAQATHAALAALESGRSRLQLTLPTPPLLPTARELVSQLEANGTACRVFVPRAMLAAWRACMRDVPDAVGDPSSATIDVSCSVFGFDTLDEEEDVLVLIAPCNRAELGLRRPEDEPDAYVLESVQTLLLRANERPVIMLNADLEALVLSPRPMRPVRPMFMADFFEAFFYAVAEGPAAGDTVAVRRAYPGDWEVYRRDALWPEIGNAVALAHESVGKPIVADMLADENRRAKLRYSADGESRMERNPPNQREQDGWGV